jgi:hypothetical protein
MACTIPVTIEVLRGGGFGVLFSVCVQAGSKW